MVSKLLDDEEKKEIKRKHSKPMKGIEKAAALMLSLTEERATKLFALMDEHEIKEISQAMALLGMVESGDLELIFEQFSEEMGSAGNLVGSFESTERLLKKALPGDRVNSIMEEIRGPAGRTMWDKLGNINEELLANYLKNEYPQTIALVLSKVKPDHSARILALFPEALAMEVVMRMLRMDSVQKEILYEVENTLKTELMNNLVQGSKNDSYSLMAEIFNNLDRSTEVKFLNALEQRSEDAAERVKALMFTFEDIKRIDGSGIQRILKEADKNKLALALKGGSDEIKELFIKNMSERGAKLLREDMRAMGMVKVRDVDEAQSYLVEITKELSSTGQIEISSGSEEEQFIA
jgi:flagellar motor switch protein FliG